MIRFIIALLLMASPTVAQDGNLTTIYYKSEAVPTLVFYEDERPEPIGTLFWRDGRFHFDGNTTESARRFLEELNRQAIDFCRELWRE